MEAIRQKTKNRLSDEERKWFDELIQAIRLDSVYLDSGLASKAKKEFYKPFFEGDEKKIAYTSLQLSHAILTKHILLDYLNEVFHVRQTKVQKIAFNLSGSDLLVWAIISDNDDEDEDKLLLAEAKVNALWQNYSYNISTTIVESGDNIPIPSQYQALT